ncbi:MAG TPA: efflux RND transporter periplasmic adaptor subunit [Thermoanaerobaculia bacterium]|nr:efflux RND transporter periplasmic adaptor subunit [Thermoanaerobaculia bacterium]
MRRLASPLSLLLLAACAVPEDPNGLLASGHVEATEVRISAEVAGRLERLAVGEGDRVRAGQELARLDATATRLALATAEAEKAQAEAELALRLAGSRVEDVAEAQAQVRRAEADLASASQDLERMETLLASGSGTEKARDDARTRREVARAQLEAARERWKKLQAGSRPEEIATARARVAAAEARLAQLGEQLADATVVSPLDGVVTEKLADAGELVAPGGGLLLVTDLAHAWLTVYVGEPDLGRVRLGQGARVTTDGGEVRTGKVTFIDSRAEFTPKNVQTRDERVKLVYRVKIGLPNDDGLFKPGMPAEALLALDAAP